MDKDSKRRPGRPPKFNEPLDSREILVPRSVDQAAVKRANEQGVSVSEVYRDWIARGRKQREKPK